MKCPKIIFLANVNYLRKWISELLKIFFKRLATTRRYFLKMSSTNCMTSRQIWHQKYTVISLINNVNVEKKLRRCSHELSKICMNNRIANLRSATLVHLILLIIINWHISAQELTLMRQSKNIKKYPNDQWWFHFNPLVHSKLDNPLVHSVTLLQQGVLICIWKFKFLVWCLAIGKILCNKSVYDSPSAFFIIEYQNI